MMDILDHVGEVSGIDSLLYSCTDRGTAQKIISLARYIVATNGEPLPLIDAFQATHPLPYEDGLSEHIYHELFLSIGRNAAVEQRFFAGRCETLGTKPTIAYDSTTISTYSEQQIDARYNGRKTGRDDDLKKIKFLVLYEARTCQPIAFRKLPGNISDVVTIRNAIEQLKVPGITDAELVTDGGYYSMENVSRLLKAGFSFITRVKTSIAWVAEAIDQNIDYMDDPAAAVPFDPAIHAVRVTKMQEFKHTRIYRTAEKELQAGDAETFRRRIYIQIYRSEIRQAEQSRALDEKLRALRDVLEGGTPLDDLSSSLQNLARQYMHIRTRAGKTIVTFNVDACREKKRHLGIFVLITNKRKGPSECLSEYRRRTLIELCFGDYKDKTDGSRPRVWYADVLQGRMFVQFVALCYLEAFAGMVQKLKDTLGEPNGDAKHDQGRILDAEDKLRVWVENNSLHHILQWFDTVETTNVSIKQRRRRWSTEITARDRLFLQRLGVT